MDQFRNMGFALAVTLSSYGLTFLTLIVISIRSGNSLRGAPFLSKLCYLFILASLLSTAWTGYIIFQQINLGFK